MSAVPGSADPVLLARPATTDDLADLVRLAGLARAEVEGERGGALLLAREYTGWTAPDRWSDVLGTDAGTVLVGCIGTVVVAYGVATVEQLDGAPLAIIEAIFVEPGAREVGVGHSLMDALVRFARDRGCRGIDARALPGDRDTKNFFESSGLVARLLTVHRDLTADDGGPG